MGLFSKVKELGKVVDSINDAAGQVSKMTVEDFGQPEYTLYTARELRDIHQKIEITDEEGKVRYYTKSSMFVLKGETDIMDAGGNIIAHLEKKPVSLHEKHFINMADGRNFTLSNELLHVVKDITNIEGLGWQIQGNIIGFNFNLVDESGQPVASIGKRAVSIHDKYNIDMYQPNQEQVVVAIVIQLEKMLEARSENDSDSSFSLSF